MNREQLIKLRENLIKYLPEKTKEIEIIAQIFIKNPEVDKVVKNSDYDKIKELTFKKGRDYVSTGHGAFGEPEGYFTSWIIAKDGSTVSNDSRNYVVADVEGNVVGGVHSIDLEKLQDEIVEKFRETIIQ